MSIARLTALMENTPKERAVYQNVSSNGDGTGITDLIASAAADYFITPGPKEKYRLRRMTVAQIDGNFNAATGYRAGSALTNGITITVENGNGIIINYTPVPIKRTYDWALLSGVDSATTGAAAADINLVRWTFAKGCGDIELDGSKGEFLKVSFGDAMNFMTSLNIQVQGCKS